jgi:hypothetical protein
MIDIYNHTSKQFEPDKRTRIITRIHNIFKIAYIFKEIS